MRRAISASWYLLVTSVVGIAWASLLVSLLATGLGLLLVVVGAFVLIATARLVRWVDDTEIRRAARFRRSEVPTPTAHEAADPEPVTLPARVRREWDRRTTRRALEGLAGMITGPVLLSTTLVLWAVPLGIVSTPILVAVGLEPFEWWDEHLDVVADIGEWPVAIALAAVGLLLAPVAAILVRRLATAVADRTLALAAS